MDRSQEKTTVPYPPVGADGGQSLSQKPNQSIAEEQAEHKPQERDFREILRHIDRVSDPAYLPSLGTQFDLKSKEAGKHFWCLPALITAEQGRAGRSMAAHLCAVHLDH